MVPRICISLLQGLSYRQVDLSMSFQVKFEKNELTFCPEYKVLRLGQIQYIALLSATVQILKNSGGCIMFWVYL
jgi:hypothetical protein